LTVTRTHPFAIQRAKELDLWHRDGYEQVTQLEAEPIAEDSDQ
jgi:hypothetical protein